MDFEDMLYTFKSSIPRFNMQLYKTIRAGVLKQTRCISNMHQDWTMIRQVGTSFYYFA